MMRTCVTFLVLKSQFLTSVFSSSVKVPSIPEYLQNSADFLTKAEKTKTSRNQKRNHKTACDEPSVPYQPEDITFSCNNEDFSTKTVCHFTSETCSGSILCKTSWDGSDYTPNWRSNVPGLKLSKMCPKPITTTQTPATTPIPDPKLPPIHPETGNPIEMPGGFWFCPENSKKKCRFVCETWTHKKKNITKAHSAGVPRINKKTGAIVWRNKDKDQYHCCRYHDSNWSSNGPNFCDGGVPESEGSCENQQGLHRCQSCYQFSGTWMDDYGLEMILVEVGNEKKCVRSCIQNFEYMDENGECQLNPTTSTPATTLESTTTPVYSVKGTIRNNFKSRRSRLFDRAPPVPR